MRKLTLIVALATLILCGCSTPAPREQPEERPFITAVPVKAPTQVLLNLPPYEKVGEELFRVAQEGISFWRIKLQSNDWETQGEWGEISEISFETGGYLISLERDMLWGWNLVDGEYITTIDNDRYLLTQYGKPIRVFKYQSGKLFEFIVQP